jgi:hypothetical protein
VEETKTLRHEQAREAVRRLDMDVILVDGLPVLEVDWLNINPLYLLCAVVELD